MKKTLSILLLLLTVLSPTYALSSSSTVGIGSDFLFGSGIHDFFLAQYITLGGTVRGETTPLSFTIDFRSECGYNRSSPSYTCKWTVLPGMTVDFGDFFSIDLLASFSSSVTFDKGDSSYNSIDFASGAAVNIGVNLSSDDLLTMYIGFGAEYALFRKRPFFNVCCGIRTDK